MSERFTAIALPGVVGGAGLADYGRKSVPEMIAAIRAKAAREKADAEAILAAADEDFRVETYVGAFVQRKREVLQEGRPKPSREAISAPVAVEAVRLGDVAGRAA